VIEKVCTDIEGFTLHETTKTEPAVHAFLDGKVILLKFGFVFSFIFDPRIANLTETFSVLKERKDWQTMSTVCTYNQAKQIVDRNRVNEDFFRLTAYFCSNVIIRIPIDTTIPVPFQYNSTEGTMQFISFEAEHPTLNAFREELAVRGCEYISITSGNVHGAPTIDDTESAKRLAVLFNIKASFLGRDDVQTVVADVPTEKGVHKGSFTILDFCNPNAIEVKRLANKTEREFTEKYLKELFAKIDTQTPLVYAV
jgi:hypothetical protein